MSDSCNAQTEQEGSTSNVDLDKEKLDDVAGGLAWWDNGEYGTCEKCGCQVPQFFFKLYSGLCNDCYLAAEKEKQGIKF